MKQLTILCSTDLAGRVEETLIRAGVEGFLHLPGGAGVKPGAAAPHGRPPRWRADLFIAPVPDGTAPRVVAALEAWAGSCESEPCLRILVGPLDSAH